MRLYEGLASFLGACGVPTPEIHVRDRLHQPGEWVRTAESEKLYENVEKNGAVTFYIWALRQKV